MTNVIDIKKEVPRIIHSLLPEIKVISFEEIQQGIQNKVFILKQSCGEDLILRIIKPTLHSWKPYKEEIVYKLLMEQGLPVPKIIKVDTSQNIIPFDISISSRLPGESMSEKYNFINFSQKLSVYRELGEIVAKIHNITFDQFGDVKNNQGTIQAGEAWEITESSALLNQGPFTTWEEMHTELVEARVQYFKGTPFNSLTHDIREYFKTHNHFINYKIIPRLLHMDLHRKNIFMNHGHISGIIDVEESIIGHNEYDLMRIHLAHFEENNGEHLKKAFLEGYTKIIPLDKGYESRQNFYKLSRTLVHIKCLILKKEQYSNNLKEDINEAKELVYKLITDNT